MKRVAMLWLVGALVMTGCKKKQEPKAGAGAAVGGGSGGGTGTGTGAEAEVVGVDAEVVPPMVDIPPALPLPAAPAYLGMPPEQADTRTTPEKMSLGYLLFFDKRLSGDESMACEGCHHTDKGWSSGQALDKKVGGALNKRNAPSMLGIGYHTSFYWDGRKPTLEATVLAAWAGQLGAKDKEADIAAKLNAIPVYRAHFQRAFGGAASKERIAQAMASFLRMVIAGDAPRDLYEKGDKTAISEEAARGFEVFRTAGCAACHVPPLYSDLMFHDIGIGRDKKEPDHGRKDATEADEDDGKFKTPSLRNVTLTAPYFHDGSVATLDAAIDLVLAGGGGAGQSSHLDPNLKPVTLSKPDRQALGAFIASLTGKPTFDKAPTLP
jgi:cytochrome c peroxidase